nr:alpha/beta hydrolase [Micromonospora sp. DSM 115978]
MTAPVGGRIKVEDLSLHVEQVRDGDGGAPEPAVVVLVHGIAGSTADWHDVVGELASRRRVLAYDQRGHGRSGWAPDHASYTFDRLVRDLDVVVSTTGADPVDLVGHSMGGVVALRYALERPSRVRSLVLVDTA